MSALVSGVSRSPTKSTSCPHMQAEQVCIVGACTLNSAVQCMHAERPSAKVRTLSGALWNDGKQQDTDLQQCNHRGAVWSQDRPSDSIGSIQHPHEGTRSREPASAWGSEHVTASAWDSAHGTAFNADLLTRLAFDGVKGHLADWTGRCEGRPAEQCSEPSESGHLQFSPQSNCF